VNAAVNAFIIFVGVAIIESLLLGGFVAEIE
jgi:hypothetical protein